MKEDEAAPLSVMARKLEEEGEEVSPVSELAAGAYRALSRWSGSRRCRLAEAGPSRLPGRSTIRPQNREGDCGMARCVVKLGDGVFVGRRQKKVAVFGSLFVYFYTVMCLTCDFQPITHII